MTTSDTQAGLLARFKHHHIYQVAAAYGAAIAILIPIVADAFPYFGWAGAVSAVIIVLIAGLPVAVLLAWLLIKPANHGEPVVWRRKHWIVGGIIAPLVVAAVVVSAVYAFRSAAHRAAHAAAEPVAAAQVPAKPAGPVFSPPADTLVVLPFKNLSGDPQQQYFSDGITEELTSALGQNPALRVIAWDTASTLRNTALTASQVGQKLNVANVLHGSIEREGDAVRISVELVNAVTGYELWSQHYDDTFANIFAVQDKVSQAIASALQVKFAQADLPTGGTRNPQAHDLVLKGRALMDKYDAASVEAARKDFEQAIALDPDYADAHAWLAHALFALTERSDLPLKATLPQIRAEAEKAIALDPRNAEAWLALGDADGSTIPPDLAKAKQAYQKALALDPSNANAHLDYGLALPLKPGLAEEQEATQLDPDNAIAWNNLASYYFDLSDWAQMVTAAQALVRIDPATVDSAFGLAYAYQQLHQYDKMVAAFDLVKPGNAVDQEQVTTGRLVYRAVADPALRPQALAALKGLSRHQSNPDVAENLIVMYAALGEHAAVLQTLETLCPAAPIACNDLAINPMYTALRADPAFQKLAKRYTTVTVE